MTNRKGMADAELEAIRIRNERFWDAAAERDCPHPTEAEKDRDALLAEVDVLTAECKRHRDANLVRAVLGTTENGDAVAEWVTEIINSETFDRVPWMITETFRARTERAEKVVHGLQAVWDDLKNCAHAWDPECARCRWLRPLADALQDFERGADE